jgi:hypothetical protein
LLVALQPFQTSNSPYSWVADKPTLEDVFIYLMQQATDNFQTEGKA